MQPCLQPGSLSLQIFLPFLDHKYYLRFVLDPSGQPSRKSVLTAVQTHLGLKGFTFYERWRPTWFFSMWYKKNASFWKVKFLSTYLLSGLFPCPTSANLQDTGFVSVRTGRALVSEHTSAIFQWRSHFLVLVTFLLCGASSSQLIWPLHIASQEDRAGWKSNAVPSHLTSLQGNWVLETGKVGWRFAQNTASRPTNAAEAQVQAALHQPQTRPSPMGPASLPSRALQPGRLIFSVVASFPQTVS